MIISFGDAATEDVYHERRTARARAFGNIQSAVKRKLDMIDAATTLDDLRSPPGNRLEKLSGGLSGFYSIRINAEWRIIFRWSDAYGAADVRITDYH